MVASSPFPVPSFGLVGREREQQRLSALLRNAAGGHGQLVLIGGEAGIGKTALARGLTAEAAAHGMTVLTGHCYDLSVTPPYGPWRELLTRHPSVDALSLLPSALNGASEPGSGGEAALFQQVLDVLTTASADRAGIVILEDVHWADQASLDLLRFLGQRISALPLLLVATYRADELTRRHPFAQLLPMLVREAPTERIDVRRLDDGDLRALLADRYGLPIEAETRLGVYVQRVAEGNPFYAQELLRSLEEERVLSPGDVHWSLGNLERVRVPPLLQQVVDGRLARLGEVARDHLAVAAVIGQRVPLDLWQVVSGFTEDDLLQTVERAVEAHLLEAGNDGADVEFAHALVREVLYEGLLPPRRRAWHRRVAEVLSEMPVADPDAVAYHFVQAGDPRASDWLVRAGDRAFRAYAWLTARDRFTSAVALMEGDPARASERGWLLYRLGRLLRLSNPAQGVAYLEEAERVAATVADPLLAAYALVDRGQLLCLLTEMERGVAALAAGVEALETLPADRSRPDPKVEEWIADATPATVAPVISDDMATTTGPLAARRGTLASWLGHTGRFTEARSMGDTYLAQAAEIALPNALALSGIGDAEMAVGLAEAAMGRPAAARDAFRRSQGAFRAIDHYYLVGLALAFELTEIVLPYCTTDVSARRVLVAEAATELARAGGALESAWGERSHDMDLLLLEGAWTEADRRARTSLPDVHLLRRLPAVLGLALLARWRGEPAEAWTHLDLALPQGAAAQPGSQALRYATAAQRLATELALDATDLRTASAWLAAHDAWLAWSGAVRGQAEARRLWARYYRITGDLGRAAQTAAAAVRAASEPRQPLVLLGSHRLLGEIATEAKDWSAAETNLLDALALADACAAPFERALTVMSLAELRVAEGKMPEASRLVEEVRAIGLPLGAALLLARADAVAAVRATRRREIDAQSHLSTREIEVLRLVAAGRSNPEIAQDLFVSPRTVTTHLTHIFAKLRVESRAEAVAFALRLGLI